MDQYKQYVMSAMLAKFAYSNSDTLGDLWFKMRDSKREMISNVFKGVKEVPQFYNDGASGAYAFSMLKDRTLYFVFRGTNDTQDMMVDLDLKRVPFFEGQKQSHIKVHEGFKKQFEGLKYEIVKTVEKYYKKIDSMYFIGHSLGGAIATLMSSYIRSNYRGYMNPETNRDIEVICHTFGSPRVGNREYVKWFQENIRSNVRITNIGDPVSQMPGSAFFEHVSDATCIMDDLIVINLPDGKWYWRLFKLNMKCCSLVEAHTCDQYIERLMKIYMNLKKREDEVTTVVVIE